MSIISFFRRIKFRYANDKAVDDFERVARERGLLLEKSAFDAAMEHTQREDKAAWDKVVEDLTGKKQ